MGLGTATRCNYLVHFIVKSGLFRGAFMPLDTDVIVPQDKTPVVRLDLRTSATDSNGLWRLSRTSLNLDRHYLDTS